MDTPRTDAAVIPLDAEINFTFEGCDKAEIIATAVVHADFARQLERESAALAAALQRYISAYPAFRMKPVGAPGSSARIEQENLMALEEDAQAALSKLRA